MKYIVTRQDDGTEEIFIFPRSVNHNIMAESVAILKEQSWGEQKLIYRKAISAGFVTGGKCRGMSETLQLCSREVEDNLLLNGP